MAAGILPMAIIVCLITVEANALRVAAPSFSIGKFPESNETSTYSRHGIYRSDRIYIANNENAKQTIKIDSRIAQFLQEEQWDQALGSLLRLYSDPDEKGEGIQRLIVRCYTELGREAREDNNFDDALDYFEKGLQYAENNPVLFMEIGQTYFLCSNYTEAEAAFLKTIALSPEFYAAYVQLGQVYYLLNDTENALYYWQFAQGLNPDDETLAARIKKLEKQIDISKTYDNDFNYVFSVSFDGETNARLSEIVMDALWEAQNEMGLQFNAWPSRIIAVTLLTNEDFSAITDAPAWAGGIYEGQIKIPVGNWNNDAETLKHIVFHEYIHALIYDSMSNRCPWWLNEGLAQYFSGDERGNRKKHELIKQIPEKSLSFSLAALPGDIKNHAQSAMIAYSLALSAVDYLLYKYTIYDFQYILELMGSGYEFQAAIWYATGSTMEEFEADWKQSLSSY